LHLLGERLPRVVEGVLQEVAVELQVERDLTLLPQPEDVLASVERLRVGDIPQFPDGQELLR
jgi:hypothetical protein